MTRPCSDCTIYVAVLKYRVVYYCAFVRVGKGDICMVEVMISCCILVNVTCCILVNVTCCVLVKVAKGDPCHCHGPLNT